MIFIWKLTMTIWTEGVPDRRENVLIATTTSSITAIEFCYTDEQTRCEIHHAEFIGRAALIPSRESA